MADPNGESGSKGVHQVLDKSTNWRQIIFLTVFEAADHKHESKTCIIRDTGSNMVQHGKPVIKKIN